MSNIRVFFAALLLVVGTSAAYAGVLTEGMNWDLKACGNPCVLQDNLGGEINKVKVFIRQVQADPDALVMIAGHCPAGCALVADLARPKTCLMPSAQLGFNIGYNSQMRGDVEVVTSFFEPPHSQQVKGWVHAHNGFPKSLQWKTDLHMSSQEAISMGFRPCTADQIRQRGRSG